MHRLGKKLRTIRERLGLSLHEVARRSQAIAQASDSPHGQISASWLRRVENDPRHELSAIRLIVLLKIYDLTLEEAFEVPSIHADSEEAEEAVPTSVELTMLIPRGPTEIKARLSLPDDSHRIVPPERTEMVRNGQPRRGGRFIRAVIGKQRNYLHPIVPAGSIVLVDTSRRSLKVGHEGEVEIRRPMFLLESHEGCICCWCESLGKEPSRIIVLPHPCAGMKAMELRLDRDVEVRGRVVAVRIPTVLEENVS